MINLALATSDHSLADEPGVVKTLGRTYHHIPVDFAAPNMEDPRAFLQVMDDSGGKKVFVHCAANYRVSCFVSLYG